MTSWAFVSASATKDAPPLSSADVKGKLEGQATAMMGVMLLNLGMRTGVWEEMRGGAPVTAAGLAKARGLSERYIEEILRAAALHGYLQFCPSEGGEKKRRVWDSGVPGLEGEAFALSKEMEEVLFEEESPSYYGHSLALPMCLTGPPFESLVKAVKSDAGVPYSLFADGKFGDFVEKAHARIYATQTKDWMGQPELAGVKTTLEKGGVVLDLGCGSASSSIAMANAFPNSTVHAVDCDQASTEKGKLNIKAAEERGEVRPGQVLSHCCFAHEAPISPGSVDLVLIFISLHDMNNPSEVLASTQPLLAPGGTVLVLEFTAPESFSSLMSGGEVSAAQRGLSTFCYSASVLHCLPVSKVETPSQAVGTQFSLPTMKVVASKAGFSRVSSVKANDAMTLFIINK